MSSFLLGETKAELGGSEFQYVLHGVTEGRPPQIDLACREAQLQDAVLEALFKHGLVRSAHDLSEGGLAVALAESCISGNLGAEVNVEIGAASLISRCSVKANRVSCCRLQPEQSR